MPFDGTHSTRQTKQSISMRHTNQTKQNISLVTSARQNSILLGYFKKCKLLFGLRAFFVLLSLDKHVELLLYRLYNYYLLLLLLNDCFYSSLYLQTDLKWSLQNISKVVFPC